MKGKSEINDLHLKCVNINDDVLRLDIPMDYLIIMAFFDPHQDIREQIFDLWKRDVEFHTDEGHEIDSLEIFHKDDKFFICFVEFSKLINVVALSEEGEYLLLRG